MAHQPPSPNNEESSEVIEQWLREDGQLNAGPAKLTPLTGGVSCEIYRVDQSDRTFVVKRALARLRVAADWRANVSRNAVEYDFYKTLEAPLSGCIPQVIFHNPERGYFTMEYLGEGWANWKELMLQGNLNPEHGKLSGELLARFHTTTWQDPVLLQRFDTTDNFRQLRTDAYIRTTADKHPDLRDSIRNEADQLETRRICLIHGDFTPKNLLVREGRMMLLDAEVAWFGDPAFDVASVLNHLSLKALYHHPKTVTWEESALASWNAYCNGLGTRMDKALESRCIRLLAILMLARVDGKSPVEYFKSDKQQVVREFAREAYQNPSSTIPSMLRAWRQHLSR
jgi:5-methylthioribose kinase